MKQRRRNDEQGAALVLAVVIAMIVGGLGLAMLTRTRSEVKLSGYQAEREAAYQAAQAGADDYIAKMSTDHLYYKHWVHPAESTRLDGATSYAAGTAYASTASNNWTYPVHLTNWIDLSNGYRYNLEVKAPTTAAGGGTIVKATGWRALNPRSYRSIEVTFKGASIADFQMMSEASVAYASTATTNGLVYSQGTISYDGHANANLISKTANGVTKSSGGVPTVCPSATTGTGCYVSTAGIYTTANMTSYRTVMPVDPVFADFSRDMNEALRATQTVSGPTLYYLPVLSPATKGYGLRFFNSSGVGKVSVYVCTKNAVAVTLGDTDAPTRPSCTADSTRQNMNLPANGAIYSASSVLVWGEVNGQVTIVTEVDAVLGEPSYPSSPAPSINVLKYTDPTEDVIGIVARRDVIVPEWGPSSLSSTNPVTIWGSVVAQYGKWRSGCQSGGDSYTIAVAIPGYSTTDSVPNCGGSVGNMGYMTITGSTATKQGGYFAALYQSGRVYSYDDNLISRVPPYFPVLESAYQILRYREVNKP